MGVAIASKGLGVNFESVDSSQQHELGIELPCNDGTTRKYVRAGGACAQYDALTVDFAEGANDVVPTSAVTHPVVGICPVSGVADNYFFWMICRGSGRCKTVASAVAGSALVATATAGTLDDTTAAAGNAMTMGQGVGVTCVAADTPSSGYSTVLLS